MRKLFTALSLCASIGAIAQPEGRVFTIYNQTYTDLSSPTIITTQGWDDFDAAVPLGFNFTMMGRTTDTLFFDSDFNLGADLSFAPLDSVTHLISFSSDHIDRSFFPGRSASTVGYKTDIVNNKKITKIQWKDIGFFADIDPSFSDSANFQLWIYEDKNDIEVHWGSFDIASDYQDIFEYGLPGFGFVKNLDIITSFSLEYLYYVSNTGANPRVDSLDANGVMNATTIGFPNYPANGTVFKFSKPIPSSANTVQLNNYTKIYPTIITNECFIEITDQNFKGNIVLVDINGKLVYNQKAIAGKNILNMSMLASGNYVLNIRNEKESVFYKVVKQ